MRMIPLGRTGLEVSELCLGTMTWGSQNTEAEAHAQIERSLDRGINFIDTAEMYPTTPLSAETVGRTEEYIGTWFARTGRRDEVILATKHTGAGFRYIPGRGPISSQTIPQVVEGNLRRLQTDYIDLYQFHWPNRGSYHFRKYWDFDPSGQSRADTIAHVEDALEALQKLREQGKIRHFGLSNDSAWGTCQWLRVAEERGWPRVESMQNEYSLLCRLYDTDMAELSVNEDITLLAYSPLAAGLLSGKYRGGAVPEGSRMAINGTLGGRKTERAYVAVEAYAAIAERHGLSLPQMALAWCRTRPMPVSAIFGATSMAQLDEALGAAEVTLDKAVLDEIEAAHRAHPMPF